MNIIDVKETQLHKKQNLLFFFKFFFRFFSSAFTHFFYFILLFFISFYFFCFYDLKTKTHETILWNLLSFHSDHFICNNGNILLCPLIFIILFLMEKKSTWHISQNEFIQKAVLFLFRYSIWILLLDLIFCSSVILLCITWIEGVFIRIIVFVFMWFSCLTDFGSNRPVI